MKRIVLMMFIVGLTVTSTVDAESNPTVPFDLAQQIVDGDFSNESKESAYVKIKELLDLSALATKDEDRVEGLFKTEELIQRFGDDYTYSEDNINYDLWVGIDTLRLTANVDNDNIRYFFGFLYPTFETGVTTDSDEDLEKVNEILTNQATLLDYNQADADYEDFDWSFTHQAMTYIDDSMSYTFDWATKDLVEVRVGHINYGKAEIDMTLADIRELEQVDDLSLGYVIDQVGDNWTFVYDIQSGSKQVIWQDPLGPQIKVDLTDELMVNRIETKNLKDEQMEE